VIVWMHITAIRKRVSASYLRHYAQPYPALIPLEIIGRDREAVHARTCDSSATSSPARSCSRSSASARACAVAAQRAVEGVRPSRALIQAFIFALLTILYFGFALEEEEH
jgi:F-type H+-transporting ATPase subunit a